MVQNDETQGKREVVRRGGVAATAMALKHILREGLCLLLLKKLN